jgi:hypothetical protein
MLLGQLVLGLRRGTHSSGWRGYMWDSSLVAVSTMVDVAGSCVGLQPM